MIYMICFGMAFLFTWMLVAPCQYLGKKYYCFPEIGKKTPLFAARKNVPYLGGCALYFGFILSLVCALFLKVQQSDFPFALESNKLIGLLMGASILCFVGVIHDIYIIPFWVRFFAQVLAACVVVSAGNCIEISSFSVDIAEHSFPLLDILGSILWIVGILSIMNALEHYDGFLVGIGLIISLFLLGILVVSHQYQNAFLTLLFSGSLLGILWFQLSPPSILLGQMGSSFIGFFLACFTLNLPAASNKLPGILVAGVLFLVPILIAVTVVVRKMLGKTKKLTLQGIYRGMAHQRSAEKVLANTLFYTLLSGVAAFFIFWTSSETAAFFVLLATGILALLGIMKLYSYQAE